jgi:hypothetical protein
MFAVIGVLRNAAVDGPEAVACVKAGFTTRELADEFATEYFSTDERKRIYGDIYVQRYEGNDWKPDGGRCFIHASRALKEQYDRLLSYCGKGDVPRLVIAECNRVAPDGKQVRGKHAWIEAGDYIIDCGSYLNRFTQQGRQAFYDANQPSDVKRRTREELAEDERGELA